jgi:hypothetical protein
MPYIKQEDRDKYRTLNIAINILPEITTKGDLEYLIALLQQKYMSTREQRYSTLHDCTYATIHAGDEFRRRFLDKREDEAREINGDITL